MSETVYDSLVLEVHECGKCHVRFAMPAAMVAQRREDHETFWCPNGHPRAFLGKTKAQKLQEELDLQKRETEWARSAQNRLRQEKEATERRLAATKGVVTKMKKRSGHGVCPVQGCKRHFQNLEVHMETMHPDFKAATE